MDGYMHTAIAVAVIITAFLIGYYVSMAQHIEKGVTFTLDKLEKEKDVCMQAVTILRTEVSAMKVELTYVKKENDLLKLKLESRL